MSKKPAILCFYDTENRILRKLDPALECDYEAAVQPTRLIS
ncbi:hypothetical protein [Coleofasciculus sp. LEGE 07092]|nr:hypothetical protein [Coleofasciculus sp. LEGE 07092]